MAELTIAPGTEPKFKIGPLIDAKSRDKVHELVTDAIAFGATRLVGGTFANGSGHFYEPTVRTGVSEDARILTEEISGPIITSPMRTRPSVWPTTPNTALSPMFSPRTSTAASAWASC